MLYWTIEQKVSKPKCFQKCFISLCSTLHGCHHGPVQMSTPTTAHPAFQLFTRTRAGWPLLWLGNFYFGITKRGQLHHDSDSTHLWQHLSGLGNEIGWLVVCLFALVHALWIAKAFSGAAEKTKENLRFTFSISDLLYPHYFLVLGTRRSEQVKEATLRSQNFPH